MSPHDYTERAERNRRNAQHSTGPRSPEGKRRVSQNATKHGIYAQEIVILGEDIDAYASLVDSLAADIGATGEIEHEIVESMAAGIWRRRRFERIEAELFNAVDPEQVTEVLSGESGRRFTKCQTAHARAVRQFSGALNDFLKARKAGLGGEQSRPASSGETTEASAARDGVSHGRSAGILPAPVHSEQPREQAFTNAGSQPDREWVGAGPESGDPVRRESFDIANPEAATPLMSGAGDRSGTKPAEPATMRVEPLIAPAREPAKARQAV
jgi:hypothetical protein